MKEDCEEKREPVLEDAREKLVSINGFLDRLLYELEITHEILDKDLHADLKVRAVLDTKEATPNLRFDMNRLGILAIEKLEGSLKSVLELQKKFKLENRPRD